MTPALLIPWIFLTIGTLLSWWLDASVDGTWVGTAIVLIAFFKARLVLVHFMRVGETSAMIRWCCEGWVIVACASVLAVYWLAPGS